MNKFREKQRNRRRWHQRNQRKRGKDGWGAGALWKSEQKKVLSIFLYIHTYNKSLQTREEKKAHVSQLRLQCWFHQFSLLFSLLYSCVIFRFRFCFCFFHFTRTLLHTPCHAVPCDFGLFARDPLIFIFLTQDFFGCDATKNSHVRCSWFAICRCPLDVDLKQPI